MRWPVTLGLLAVNVLACGYCLWRLQPMPGATAMSLSYFSAHDLFALGALDGERVRAGEYWRLLFAAFLHGGPVHLVCNMFALFSLGRLLEALLGWASYTVLYFLAALAGGLGSLFFGPGEIYAGGPAVVSVGASGAIMGLAGAGMALALRLRRRLRPGLGRLIFVQLAVATALVLGLGHMLAVVDNAGHIGGLAGGLILGAILPVPRVMPEGTRERQPLMAILAVLIVLGVGETTARGIESIGRADHAVIDAPLASFHDPRWGLSLDLPTDQVALKPGERWPRMSASLGLAFDVREAQREWLVETTDRESLDLPPGARDAYLLRRTVGTEGQGVVQELAIYLVPPRAAALVIEYPDYRAEACADLAERIRRTVRWDR